MSRDSLPAEPGANGRLPLYLQVASTLRTAILRGVYPVGSRMPTEEALCRRFKVSRHTIREALRQLRADGLIGSRRSERPIVVPPPLPRPEERIGAEIGADFFDYVIGTRLEIASMAVEPVAAGFAAETGLPPGEEWLRVTGYRTGIDDGRITCWNDYAIDACYAAVAPLLARQVGPIIPLLEDLFDRRIARITRSTSAVATPAAQAERFGVVPGSPALSILTRCETADGKAAMLNRSLHPHGTISYTIRR
jgi:DNA-binding GntR family transcriptional regulator